MEAAVGIRERHGRRAVRHRPEASSEVRAWKHAQGGKLPVTSMSTANTGTAHVAMPLYVCSTGIASMSNGLLAFVVAADGALAKLNSNFL